MFSTTGTITGIDLGSRSVKLVRAKGGSQPKLLNAAVEELSGESEDAWKQEAGRALERLLKAQGLGARDLGLVHAAVTGASVQLKQVDLPPLNDEELRASLKYEARKHLSFGSTETALDCQVMTREAEGAASTLIVGAPDSLVAAHVAVLNSLGIEPEIVDAGPLALLNGAFSLPGANDETIAIMDLGRTGTTLTMARRGGALYTRTVPVSGPPDETVSPLSGAFRETSQYFAPMNERRKVDRVFLCGGHALAPEFEISLQDALGIPVSTLDLTQGLPYSPSGSGKTSEAEVRMRAPQLAVALGLLHWGPSHV